MGGEPLFHEAFARLEDDGVLAIPKDRVPHPCDAILFILRVVLQFRFEEFDRGLGPVVRDAVTRDMLVGLVGRQVLLPERENRWRGWTNGDTQADEEFLPKLD